MFPYNYYDYERQPEPPPFTQPGFFGDQFGSFPGPFGGFFNQMMPGGQFFPGFGPPIPPPGFGPPVPPPGGGPFTPPGAGAAGGPPSGPPPSFVPPKALGQTQGPGVFAVNPGAIRPCTFRYVYLWLVNGQQFWAWLVFVGRDSLAGWRWTGFNWVYFGTDLRNVDSFVCY